MKILIINNQTTRLQQLEKLLDGHSLTIINHSDLAGLTDGAYDLTVLTGSSTNAVLNRNGVYAREEAFIRTTVKPVIGICLGFELIVHAYNGHLVKLPEKVEGWEEVVPVAENSYITGPAMVHEGHRWAVVELPECFIGHARSVHGWELIKHMDKPLYGMQFHPEVYEIGKMDGREIFGNILHNLT